MVRCEDCVLIEVLGNPTEKFWNKCLLLDKWNLDLNKERECEEFQPKP